MVYLILTLMFLCVISVICNLRKSIGCFNKKTCYLCDDDRCQLNSTDIFNNICNICKRKQLKFTQKTRFGKIMLFMFKYSIYVFLVNSILIIISMFLHSMKFKFGLHLLDILQIIQLSLSLIIINKRLIYLTYANITNF